MKAKQIILSSEKANKLADYLRWVEPQDSDKSSYWKAYSKEVQTKIDNNCVSISGLSGFYFPKDLNLRNRFSRFLRLFPINLSYFIFLFYRNFWPTWDDSTRRGNVFEFLSTYERAYDNIWGNDPLTWKFFSSQALDFNTLNNEILDFRTIRGMKKKWMASKTHVLNEATIRSYYFLQILEGTVEKLQGSTVCEIGPGTGNLASLMFHHFNTKLFLIDLPETLHCSFCYLSQHFPNAKILLPNEIEAGNHALSEYDIVMLTPNQASLIPDKTVDLTVNLSSMQEMTRESINFYFKMVDRITKPKGYFFASNRVEKSIDGQSIRFSEYPWRSHTRTVYFQIDPLYGLTQIDPLFFRLQQYP